MKDVTEFLPHRPPMLMLDRVLELSENSCKALKNISYAEPCFQGHFPGEPIFPGVLIIEAMAQTGALWLREKDPANMPIFAGIKEARFLRKVVPVDQLILECRLIEERKGFYTFDANAKVAETEVCQAQLVIIMKPPAAC